MENLSSKTLINEVMNSDKISKTLRILLQELIINLDELSALIAESEEGKISSEIKIPTKCRIIKAINESILNEQVNEQLYGAIVSMNATLSKIACSNYLSNISNILEESEEKSLKKSRSLHL